MDSLLHHVVFLDRDGVINRDSPDYIKSWAEFEFLPGTLKAFQLLKTHGFTAIVITNQSAVNRKIMSSESLQDLHIRMKTAISQAGGEIRDIFFCPHTPDERCNCRKPKTGLIQEARKQYGINLKSAVMIGDSAKDIECGKNAGCARCILVKTGNGLSAQKALAEKGITPDDVAEDLYDAVQRMMADVRC